MAGGGKGIGVEEAEEVGVVVAGLEVIQGILSIIDISTVAQGIMDTEVGSHGAGCAKELAPCVVSVLDNRCTAGIQNSGNVTLQVSCIVVIGTIVGDGQGSAGRVIGKVQGIAAHGHLAQTAAVIDIAVSGRTVGSLGSQTVRVVGEVPGSTAAGHGCQLTAMLPGIGPGTIGSHITNGITGNGFSIPASQQIAPGTVTICVVDGAQHRAQAASGVGIFFFGEDIARIVIGPDPGLACCLVVLTGQLVGGVVDIAGFRCGAAGRFLDRGDITVDVV